MPKMTITKKNLKLLQNESREFDILVETLLPLSNDYNGTKMKTIQSTLKLAFKEELVFEDMKKIERLSPDVHALSQNLEGFHSKFSEQVKKINTVIDTTFSKYRDQEEKSFDKKMDGFGKKMDGFGKLQEKHKLWSIWSEYKISPSDMKKPFSDKPVESLSYESWGPTQKVKLGKIVTWLEMWKIADQVMKLSGDGHHQFIEAIIEDKKNPGHFKLSTGS